MKGAWFQLFAWAVVIVALFLVSPIQADERVDAAIATLRAQIPGIHDRIMIAITAHNEAWEDFKQFKQDVREAAVRDLEVRYLNCQGKAPSQLPPGFRHQAFPLPFPLRLLRSQP